MYKIYYDNLTVMTINNENVIVFIQHFFKSIINAMAEPGVDVDMLLNIFDKLARGPMIFDQLISEETINYLTQCGYKIDRIDTANFPYVNSGGPYIITVSDNSAGWTLHNYQ